MNIALVVHDLHVNGGHSLYTWVLAEELSRRHKVTVFANQCERSKNALWGFQPVRAWRANALATVHTFPLGLSSQADAPTNFDICHTQGFCGGQPNVVTAHICVASYLNSLCSASIRNRASLKLMATTESRFYRQYRGQVIAISQKVERELREFYGVRSEIKIIPHGVDTSRFSGRNRETYCGPVRAEFGIGAEQIIALYVGDLTKAHTHLKTLAACAPEVQFIIVSRSSQYRWNMPNVRFLPPTTELERYYAAADAFVFPTTYDAFGMVVLEAMASGLAVLSSDRAGAAELIDSGRDGFVAPLDEWVEASAERLRNRAQLQEIGRAAEQTARQHDWLSVVNAVEQIYFEVAV